MSGARVLALALPLLLVCTPARADDVESWLSAQLAIEPLDQLELHLEPRVSLSIDAPGLSGVLLEAGLEYRLLSWLELGTAYRAMYERDGDEALALRHRVQLDVQARLDLSKLRLAYRARLQGKFRPASKNTSKATLRNRVSATYRGWKRWRPAMSVELFVRLEDFDAFERDAVRFTVGLQRALSKAQALEVFYRVEALHADKDDPVLHVLGLSWSYDLTFDDD